MFNTDVVHIWFLVEAVAGPPVLGGGAMCDDFFLMPLLQLALGHYSWKVNWETQFPPLLPSEIYICDKLLRLSLASVAGTSGS